MKWHIRFGMKKPECLRCGVESKSKFLCTFAIVMDYRIFPPDGILEARVNLPLSKSISNRALIINALTPGASPLPEVAVCDDTDAMVSALASPDEYINIGAAGTAMRFLTAYFAAGGREGTTILDGSERMRQRPIGPLVDALRACGAKIEYEGEEGFPPLRITGRRLAGGEIAIPASISSQYISALLMVAPTMEHGLTLRLEGEIMSLPYIRMTLAMMRQRGAKAEFDEREGRVTVAPGVYDASCPLPVEADWSAAAFWYEIVALTAGWVTLAGGLTEQSLQGDAAACPIFGRLGVSTSWEDVEEGDAELSGNPDADARLDIDMRHTPDMAQAVIVTCAMLGTPFSISGLDSLRIKETDRLDALSRELLKTGIAVEIHADILKGLTMSWNGSRRPIVETPEFDTYKDHRMAMAFAPVAVFIPGIVVRDVDVVAKSYPGYWDALRDAGFILEEA